MQEKYRRIAEEFAEKYKKDPNVVIIFATGSVVHSTPDKNSDIDIHIILSTSKWRERRNTFVGNIEIECFINPIIQIEEYLKTEKQKHTAHMIVNSFLIYNKGKAFEKLLRKAKIVLKKKQPAMNTVQKNLARYALDDGKKDLEDIYLRKDPFAFFLAANNILNECLSVFYKIKRIREEKVKRVEKYLHIHDPVFAKLFVVAVKESDYQKKFSATNKTIAYVEKMIGKRPREWKLRGPLTIPK